ncbi:MAG: MFS transporter [Bacillota bacterium]|nr:MFS transporter [Bacillota bacterium]
MPLNYDSTRRTAYLGYVTQAIINNLPPLFFVIFRRDYGLGIPQLGSLVLANFIIQLVVDLLAVRYVDRIGYRPSIVFGTLTAACGLLSLGILPQLLPDAFAALFIALTLNAIGGGLIEVLVSPIVNFLPGEAKASRMALLHSFYCWGHLAVVILTTLMLLPIGEERWWLLPLLWMAVPLTAAFLFSRVPIIEPRAADDSGPHVPVRRLLRQGGFWLMLLLMLAAGAGEQIMAQWSSFFAEAGLGVSKITGDLAGPSLFALFMGCGRFVTGLMGTRLRLRRVLFLGGIALAGGYLLTVFAPWPALSLAGCAVAGLGVSVMWPGVTSLADERYPGGGTALFGLLAVAGDLGCAMGPWLAGLVSAAVIEAPAACGMAAGLGFTVTDFGLRTGILIGLVFPVLLIIGARSPEPGQRS